MRKRSLLIIASSFMFISLGSLFNSYADTKISYVTIKVVNKKQPYTYENNNNKIQLHDNRNIHNQEYSLSANIMNVKQYDNLGHSINKYDNFNVHNNNTMIDNNLHEIMNTSHQTVNDVSDMDIYSNHKHVPFNYSATINYTLSPTVHNVN